MAKTRQLAETLRSQAEAGDTSSGRALHDLAEEEGWQQPTPLEEGDWAVYFTASYFYVGELAYADYEEYVLKPGSWVVYETGNLKSFFEEGRIQEGDPIPVLLRVRRGGVIAIGDWPTKKAPAVRGS